MSQLARLNMLKTRHRALDVELAEACAHRSADDQELKKIKFQKLLLKDQIVTIEATIRAAFS